VERKEYFIKDTIGGTTYITNIPPALDLVNIPGGFNGADTTQFGGTVEFVDGKYSTTNPEEQCYLDLRGGFITELEWKRQRMTPQEIQLAEHELHLAELERNRKEMEELRAQLAR
jgi:hypothetical protein